MGDLTTRHRAAALFTTATREGYQRRKLGEIAEAAFQARAVARSRRGPVLPIGAIGAAATMVCALAATVVAAVAVKLAPAMELAAAAQGARYDELARRGEWEVPRRGARSNGRSRRTRVADDTCDQNRFAALERSPSPPPPGGGSGRVLSPSGVDSGPSRSAFLPASGGPAFSASGSTLISTSSNFNNINVNNFRSMRSNHQYKPDGLAEPSAGYNNAQTPVVLKAPFVPIPPASKSRSRGVQQRTRQARASVVRCNAALRGVAQLGEWGGIGGVGWGA